MKQELKFDQKFELQTVAQPMAHSPRQRPTTLAQIYTISHEEAEPPAASNREAKAPPMDSQPLGNLKPEVPDSQAAGSSRTLRQRSFSLREYRAVDEHGMMCSGSQSWRRSSSLRLRRWY